MFNRKQNLSGRHNASAWLWGARQTGKSTLLKKLFPDSPYYDLLIPGQYERLTRNPDTLINELSASAPKPGVPVIIDEVQKVPQLLDAVQWLIVNKSIPFILCGSSARKLKRSHANLLGGRAIRYELYPLVSAEIPDFDLPRALNHGLLPRHYLADEPQQLIQSYVAEYLKEEIAAEALLRNIPTFMRFLETAAFSNAEIVNYTNIASDCGVSNPTVKEYFRIFEDTLIGRMLPAYAKRPKRRIIHAPKFYFFDLAIANYLLKRGPIVTGSDAFGKTLEHFIFQELYAHSRYSGLQYDLAYWRASNQMEVDFILGDHEIALEIKATEMAHDRHLRGLKSFAQEYKVRQSILISCDPRPRLTNGVLILPWKDFLARLWSGQIIK